MNVRIHPSLARANQRRTRIRAQLAGLATLALASAAWLAGGTDPVQAATPPRSFAATSPFNVAIPASPKIDPNSAAMVSRVTRTGQLHAAMHEFGIPVYTATASTPRYTVRCTMEPAWGRCPLTGLKVPIPTNAVPQVGSDGAMVVLDPTTGMLHEYWQLRRSGSGWVTSWAAVNPHAGSGWGGGSTGAGASRLGGVVRTAEIAAGSINHALVVSTDNACPRVFRAPAVKTDGSSSRSDCLPEGSRLQLDPSLDLDKISGLTRGEKAVAKAMQTYGAYVIDNGGAPLTVSFERAADASWSTPGSVYQSAGFSWDYYGMPRVPWHKLRVLR